MFVGLFEFESRDPQLYRGLLKLETKLSWGSWLVKPRIYYKNVVVRLVCLSVRLSWKVGFPNYIEAWRSWELS